MVFNYAGSEAFVNLEWSVSFKESSSSEWLDLSAPFSVKVVKNAAALTDNHGERTNYISNVFYNDIEENGSVYRYFSVFATPDVSKIKISYVNSDTGKTKSATYQTTSSNVIDIVDISDYNVWTIRMNITAPVQDNTYQFQCRGLEWSECIGVVIQN